MEKFARGFSDNRHRFFLLSAWNIYTTARILVNILGHEVTLGTERMNGDGW
jgi:hypothetical protein